MEIGHEIFASELKKQILSILEQVAFLSRLYMLFTLVCFVIDLICWFVFFGFIVWDTSTLKFIYDYNTVFGGSSDYTEWL